MGKQNRRSKRRRDAKLQKILSEVLGGHGHFFSGCIEIKGYHADRILLHHQEGKSCKASPVPALERVATGDQTTRDQT